MTRVRRGGRTGRYRPGLSASTLPIYTLSGGHYQYNWSTKNVASGLYRIFAKLADGSTQFVDICVAK